MANGTTGVWMRAWQSAHARTSASSQIHEAPSTLPLPAGCRRPAQALIRGSYPVEMDTDMGMDTGMGTGTIMDTIMDMAVHMGMDMMMRMGM